MDSQDHKKTNNTGHETHGVHLCHRCGWPFPKPHPSAKHRRAHKRVCGTIEGYKVILSEAESAHNASSDDEHGSDEDFRTPSPTVEKKDVKEFGGNSVVGDKSYRSEDEVFSDAVTEFSDSGVSPRVEARLQQVHEYGKSGEKDGEGNPKASQLLEVDGTPETTEQLNEQTNSRVICDAQVLEDAMDPSNDTKADAKSVGSSTDLPSGSIVSESKGDTIMDKIDDGDQKSQEAEVFVEQDVVTEGREDQANPKSSVTVEIIAGEKKEDGDKFDSEVVEDELRLNTETPQHILHTSAEVEKEAESAMGINNESGHETNEVCQPEIKQDSEHFITTSLPVDSRENIIEDFKDYKSLKSELPLDLGPIEETSSTTAADDVTVAEDSTYTIHPVKNDGSSHTSIVSNDVEDELRAEAAKVPELSTTSVETGHVETHPVTSEYSLADGSNTISAEEPKQNTNSNGVETAGTFDMNKNDKDVETGKEDGGFSKNVLSVESKLATDYTGSSPEPENGLKSSKVLDAENGSEETEPVGNIPPGQKVDSSVQLLGSTDYPTSFKEDSNQRDSDEQVRDSSAVSVRSGDDGSQETHKGLLTNENAEALDHDGNIPVDIQEENVISLDKSAAASTVKETVLLPSTAEGSMNQSTTADEKDVSGIKSQLSEDGNIEKRTEWKDGASAVYISGASSSPADSLEGNWGSVSGLSSQSDLTPAAERKSEASHKSDAGIHQVKATMKEGHPEKPEGSEPPSFTTLVDQKVPNPETETSQNAEQPKPEALQAGWFPSLTNVVNESPGRKKNEEMIEKVTNWSSGKHHSPLKNLLHEAKSPKQEPTLHPNDESATKNNGSEVTTVNSILGSEEAPKHQAAPNKEMEDWNSPARYPAEIKKEKKKRRKSHWAALVCCSSVHRDL